MQEIQVAGSDGIEGEVNPLAKVSEAAIRLHHAIDKASDATGPIVDQLTANAHLATTHVEDSIAAAFNRLRATQAELVDLCKGYVRQKPIQSAGIALVAGAVLASLVFRRR